MENLENEIKNNLKNMGFLEEVINNAYNGCEIKTVESLINYIEEHNGNPPKVDVNKDLGQPISDLVNKDLSNQLMEKGFSKNVSEKSLFITGNKDLDKALEWIEQNKLQPDYEEPLFIVNKKPNLSKEEAKLEARKLQEELRKKKVEREKQEALDRERDRILNGKKMSEAKRKLEEKQQELHIEEVIKKKIKDQEEKNKMWEILERDRIERGGGKIKKKEITCQEEFKNIYDQIWKIYRTSSNNEIKTCLETIKLYMGNIMKDPSNEKFKKINLENKGFKRRVGDIIGGVVLMKKIGFVEENNCLVLKEEKNFKEYFDIISNKLFNMIS